MIQLDELKQQFGVLTGKMNQLTSYCTQFHIELPTYENFYLLEGEMADLDESWTLYKEYSKERVEIGENHWVVKEEYRKNIDNIEEFGKKWKTISKDKDLHNLCYKRIFEQSDLLLDSCVALKFCKGDVPFEEDHWMDLFRYLGIPVSTQISHLCVYHFIDCVSKISTSLDFCKKLTSRATGEVRIKLITR